MMALLPQRFRGVGQVSLETVSGLTCTHSESAQKFQAQGRVTP